MESMEEMEEMESIESIESIEEGGAGVRPIETGRRRRRGGHRHRRSVGATSPRG